jgi:membrane fusion protein (multidrug efflux system)
MRRIMIHRIAQTSAALALLVATASACKDKDASAEPTADSTATPASALSLPVVGETVRQGDLVLTVPTTAQVRADAVATLRSETVGTVDRVLIVPGQRVARGQALVTLDPRPFDLAVDEAQAAVEQAEVQYNDNIVPDSIVSGQAPSEERRKNALARSGLAGARVRLAKAKLDRDRAVITAPFAGIVDRVNVAAGERLSAGAEVTTVVNINDLRIEASVLEHDLPLIKVGGQAVITAAAAPGRQIIGRVAAVLPMIDSTTRAGRALVRFRSDGVLRPGMYADVRLESTRLTDRVIIPAPAVLERDGRPLVFVVKEGRAQWVYINPGRSNGLETEVLPDSSTGQIPVAPGDTVLVEGHLTLTHDAPVRVVAKAESE